jgi:hypothetical protein
MGRYSSVQAYADSNENVRKISYAQAAGSDEVKKGVGTWDFRRLLLTAAKSLLGFFSHSCFSSFPVKPEKVVNPYGSTAGAGSGEFHVYRHARSREMERMKALDKEEQERVMEEEFQKQRARYKQKEEEKTAKRRKKRQRQKEAKLRKKNLKKAGITTHAEARVTADDEDEEEEFSYTPADQEDVQKDEVKKEGAVEAIPNDGSFLEMMKKRTLEQQTVEKPEQEAEEESKEPPAKRQAISS